MTVLLYAPSLAGHPQVYCRVIGDILLERGCRVVIAAGCADHPWPREWHDLRPFADHSRVQLVDCRRYSAAAQPDLAAEELRRLQQDHAVDSTLFIEADHFRSEFVRIARGAAPRLRGRTVGIFARACLWYPGEDYYTGEPLPRFAPTLRGNLGRLKRRLLDRYALDRPFFEEALLRRRAVDAVVVKDERIAERFGPPVYWMPDIYKVFGSTRDEEEESEWAEFADRYRQWLAGRRPDGIALYFGEGRWYKGYDYFLRLLELEPEASGVHAGKDYVVAQAPFEFDVEAALAGLRREGRLFETRRYVQSQKLIELFFSSVDRWVSTHRYPLSSGTMLQALELGKPVLTHGNGLLGHRVRTSGLGATYRRGDVEDLRRQWRAFREQPSAPYAEAIRRFMAHFTRERVAAMFLSVLLGDGGNGDGGAAAPCAGR